jgi:S-adenosylmethionine:tRNA ribosyltransferase-isomerase
VDISDFDYDLPPSAIAQEPLPERDASRLLVLDRTTGRRTHRTFRDLPDLLDPGDLLVVNRSRVLPARLQGQRPGGGAAEILLVRPQGKGVWDALLRPGRRLKAGTRIVLGEGFEATVGDEVGVQENAGAPLRRVHLQSASGDPDDAIERLGKVPLPPYIRRPQAPADRDRYQTIYAREGGSVAAPTAGLHLSPTLLGRLDRKGVHRAEVVLHVGPGTFQPVKVRRVADHHVAPEAFILPRETEQAINDAQNRGRRVVAVGTTTTRVLETSAFADGTVSASAGETSLVIVPGFSFRVVTALVTNFHLPRSSLLLLVAAFAGRPSILEAYADAVATGYRFYSYGDAMLIL